MDTLSMTSDEFRGNIAQDERYLKIELTHGAFNKEIQDIRNVVGFFQGKAIVITDLDENQVNYYEQLKKVNIWNT